MARQRSAKPAATSLAARNFWAARVPAPGRLTEKGASSARATSCACQVQKACWSPEAAAAIVCSQDAVVVAQHQPGEPSEAPLLSTACSAGVARAAPPPPPPRASKPNYGRAPALYGRGVGDCVTATTFTLLLQLHLVWQPQPHQQQLPRRAQPFCSGQGAANSLDQLLLRSCSLLVTLY